MTNFDCTYCGGTHDESKHGDALVVREHYRRDRGETVDAMLGDARALLETLPKGEERDASLSALEQAEALADVTSAADYDSDIGWDIVRENIDAIDNALWLGGFVPVWDAGDYLVLEAVTD